MNRRLRTSELSLHDVARSIAPWQPHVDTSAGASLNASLPPGAAPADTTSGDRDSRRTRPEATSGDSSNPDAKVVEKTPFEEAGLPGGTDYYRRVAFDALHTYVIDACGYDHRLATPIFNRVVHALETNLDRKVRAEQDTAR